MLDWTWLWKGRLRFRSVFRRAEVERELEEEFRAHIERRVEQQVALGISREEAHYAAVRAFGGIEQKKEECRDVRRVNLIENLAQDVRYAFRTFWRAPGFFAIAAAILALGIGANTAIFSLVHTVLLKPLPYREPSRLVVAWDTYLAFPKLGVAPPEFNLWRQQSDIFEETAWYRYVPLDMALSAGGEDATSVQAGFLSSNFLHVMGVAPAAGRGFADRESNTVLLTDHLWRTRFTADPAMVGKTIRLNEEAFTVIGVMPASLQFPEWADVFLPQGALKTDELTNPVRHAIGFIARLRRGVTMRAASARLTALSTRLAAEHPKTSTGWGMQVSNLQDDLTAEIRPVLLLLLGGVALVLMIACANVASLMLARATGRAREIAVRSALGAGTVRIAGQLFTESTVLAMVGAGFGLVLAEAGLRAFSPVKTALDTVVLAFVLAISVVSGIVFGLAPVIHALREDPNTVIKPGSHGSGSMRAGSWLVVAEFALAMVLAASAGILTMSFRRLMNVDPGFKPQDLLTMRVAFPPSAKPDRLFRSIEERVKQIPGVDALAATTVLPLTPDHGNASRFNVPGSPLINPDSLPSAEIRFVSPSYFETMRIPVRSGRGFTEQDLNQPVVMINAEMARTFWPGRDPVGEKFITGPLVRNPVWSTIVGVVGDVKQFSLDAKPSLDVYYPALFPVALVVRTAGGPAALAGPVRAAIHSVNPNLPVSEVRTMDQIAAESARTRRATMTLLAAFASLALLLALIGIYGVMSWSVAQRRREIGIRLALGATSGEVLGVVLRHGMKLSLMGVAVGWLGAFATRRVMASLVFGVSASDPLVYGAVAASMVAVALVACYVPARRATRVDPRAALAGD